MQVVPATAMAARGIRGSYATKSPSNRPSSTRAASPSAASPSSTRSSTVAGKSAKCDALITQITDALDYDHGWCCCWRDLYLNQDVCDMRCVCFPSRMCQNQPWCSLSLAHSFSRICFGHILLLADRCDCLQMDVSPFRSSVCGSPTSRTSPKTS